MKLLISIPKKNYEILIRISTHDNLFFNDKFGKVSRVTYEKRC